MSGHCPTRLVLAASPSLHYDNRQITVDNRPFGAAAKCVCWEQVYWQCTTLALLPMFTHVLSQIDTQQLRRKDCKGRQYLKRKKVNERSAQRKGTGIGHKFVINSLETQQNRGNEENMNKVQIKGRSC